MIGLYTGSPNDSPIDEVRLKIGDTKEPYRLSDEEIQFILTDKKNADAASIEALLIIAGKTAGDVDKKVGDLSLSTSQRHKHYLTIAEERQRQVTSRTSRFALPFSGGTESEMVFKRGLHGI